MNLFYLRYFVTLAHVKHYTKAAQQLCITQPSLSHAIAQMEKELGVPLFEKSGRNTLLTPFGREFLACAEHTLSTLDDGIASLQRSARGSGLIRLGFVRPLGIRFVPRLAAEFLQAYPENDIRLTFHTGITRQLLDNLQQQKVDLLFCSKPQDDLKLTAVPVQKQELVVIVPQNHPLAVNTGVRLADTASYPHIYFTQTSGIRSVIDDMFLRENAVPNIVTETEEDEVIAGLVAEGFGIAVVPYMDLLQKLPVKILSITSPSYERNFYLVHDDSVYMPPAVENFYRFVVNWTCDFSLPLPDKTAQK